MEYRDPRPSKHIELTFGVEMEFLVAQICPDQEPVQDTHPDDPRHTRCRPARNDPDDILGNVQMCIKEKMEAVGIKARLVQPYTFGNKLTPLQLTSAWGVTTDLSVKGPRRINGNIYHWSPIEVFSPALVAEDAAYKQVGRVVHVLTSKYRIHLNSTCGLHVHVGNGVRGYSFTALRKLAAMLWVYESTISTIHDPTRVNNDHCRPLYHSSSLARRHGAPANVTSRSKGLEAIIAIEDRIELLTELCSPGRFEKLCYNFRGLYESAVDGDSSKSTIEFREHAGSMKVRTIDNWTRFCVEFVQVAVTSDERGLWRHLRKVVDRQITMDSFQRMIDDFGMESFTGRFEVCSRAVEIQRRNRGIAGLHMA